MINSTIGAECRKPPRLTGNPMRKHLFLAVATAMLVGGGVPALAQMEGGVGGGTGGSPQDARNVDRVYDELKSEHKLSPNEPAKNANELATGADLVKQSKFAEAIPHLELALAKNPDNSVTLLYLGFSHRMLGSDLPENARSDEYTKALGYYQKAAKVDPRNKLLHEYMGKLYLLMRDLPSADGELNTLVSLCHSGCEERDTLTNVIASYMVSMTPIVATTPPQKAK